MTKLTNARSVCVHDLNLEGVMATYKYPGQFEQDGIVYNGVISSESLLKIKDEMVLDNSDLVLVTYPKSGECLEGQYHPI